MDLYTQLESRWFINQFTNKELFDSFNKGNQVFYVGFDPTADSLHLGNYIQFMHALQYMLYGNKAILVVWGATWMIGDPWWKNSERSFLDEATLNKNIDAISKQITQLLIRIEKQTKKTLQYEIINNSAFYKDMGYIDFLREVGKYITVNQMMNKETVKNRLTQDWSFISYTEFSYMLMQAYDYLHLFQTKQCTLQISWSDQRWNIVTGVELIRKKTQQEVYWSTCPLITDSNGKKFGKSEWNAIRLDEEKISPYVCYNYFMNTADEDLKQYFGLLTLIDNQEIEKILENHNEAPQKRYWQEKLAYAVTKLIYWVHAANNAQLIKAILFDSNDPVWLIQGLDQKSIIMLNQATSGTATTTPRVELLDILVTTWLFTSRSTAKKWIKDHAVSLNNQKITDIHYTLTEKDYNNKVALLKKWKKQVATILWRS